MSHYFITVYLKSAKSLSSFSLTDIKIYVPGLTQFLGGMCFL